MALRRNRKQYLQLREQARFLVKNRIAHFTSHYQVRVGKVFIKNHKTRWGSCSSRGNLNFNYKVVLLPPELADYIIVHELCHLIEFNHSKKFWAKVAETMPHHEQLRKQLRAIEKEKKAAPTFLVRLNAVGDTLFRSVRR